MASSAVVGRDAELGVVETFVRSLRDGPKAFVIEGEAGVGKTTLFEEALERVAGEAQVLSCRGAQSEMVLSYAALGDLVGAALGSQSFDLPVPQRRALNVALRLEDDDEGSTDHRAVAAGFLSLLGELSRERPLVIAVDDLQWLDRSSARVLAFALRRVSTEQIGFLATLRTDPEAPSVPEHTGLIRDPRVGHLRVGPLSVGAIQQVLVERLALSLPRTALVHLHETARGNPFFAIELGRALVETSSLPGPGEPLPVPGDLRALLAERVRRLPDPARRALLLIALLPESSEQVLVKAFGDGWPAAMARSRKEGIIEVRASMVRFVHPLLASVVAGEATMAELHEAHRRLAGASDDPVARALHLALATSEPDEAVAAALEDAARETTRRGAPDATAELAELAHRLTPPEHAQDACRRCTVAGEARFAAGDSERAVELFSEAAATAEPGPERGGVLWRLAWVRFHHDDPSASRAILEEAAEEAGDDVTLRAAIEHDLSYAWLAMADARKTHQHATAAAELAERAGSTDVLADALAQVAVSEFLLGRGLREDLMERALDLEDWDHYRPALLCPTMAFAHLLSWVDRIDEARDLLERSERELLQRGDDAALPYLHYRFAELECWSGHWPRGLEHAIEADRLAVQTSQHGNRAVTCYGVALLSAHLGLADDTRRAAEEGVAVSRAAGHVLGIGLNVFVIGFLEHSLGRSDTAHAIFGPMLAAARAGGFDEPASAWWLPSEIESLIALGELDEAASLTSWMEERARAVDRISGLAAAARCRALLAAAAGLVDDALATCDEALELHDRVDAPFERARTLFAQGQIARRARKWGVARDALDAALTAFEALGARLWVDRARDEAGRIGGRPRSSIDLTETERQIAELVASGRTNREVAAALFVSPKTVSASLGRVYRKMGVASRTEMAARLRGDPPCE